MTRDREAASGCLSRWQPVSFRWALFSFRSNNGVYPFFLLWEWPCGRLYQESRTGQLTDGLGDLMRLVNAVVCLKGTGKSCFDNYDNKCLPFKAPLRHLSLTHSVIQPWAKTSWRGGLLRKLKRKRFIRRWYGGNVSPVQKSWPLYINTTKRRPQFDMHCQGYVQGSAI